MSKLGRNDPCPCGSNKKYKSCCLGKVPWPELMANNDPRGILHMEARGKNLVFLATIAAILQLDRMPDDYQWRDVKRAVTPNAVRALHEAVARYWPTEQDLRRVLHAQRGQHSALYIGTYNPDSLIRGIKRHNLYSDTILIVDPFQHPNTIRPEFNPIENPQLNIASTLAAIRIWWELAPWVKQGIVKMIRTPGDYDVALDMSSIESSRKRAEHPELRKLAKKESENWREHMPGFEEYHRLWEPDSYLEQKYRERSPNASPEEVQSFLRMINDRRLDHPFFPESVYQTRGKQLLTISGGTNFDMALLVAEETGSHLITDLSYRWKRLR
ncbi:MAG: SEC-C metal-binding domain-containing protein [Thermoanaerobaculia bacterium]